MSVKYVQRIKRADGHYDLYFRKGQYRFKLASPDGTKELEAEVEALVARVATIAAANTPTPGTVGGMMKKYLHSADFLDLAASTQIEYDRYGKEIIADLGNVLLKDVTAAWVDALRDEWRHRGYRAASNLLVVLKNALKPAIKNKTFKSNPFADLERIKRPHDNPEANPAWEDAEVEAAIALALKRNQPGLARAIGLGRWGGFRRSTICAIPLNALTTGYNEDGEPHPRISWLTEKRKVLSDKRQDPRLTSLLNATPNRALTIAYNKDGQPWKKRALNQAITRLVEALAKEGKARPNLTIHGLRHARGVELAEAGASDAEIMCQLEHATERTAKIYREQANRRTMADSGQMKVDNVINVRTLKKMGRK